MGRLKNDFSWSVSRERVFKDCPRCYYFTYYGSWGGWESDAPERTRQIYVLKQLATRWMWVGQVVHDCLRRTMTNLKNGVPPLLAEEIVAQTRERMRSDYRSSRDKVYWQRPKSPALFEHEYALTVSDEEWQRCWGHAEKCLNNFYRSDYYAVLRAMPREDYIQVEEFDSFLLDGIKVHAVLDSAYRRGGITYIADWKTGRDDTSENKQQLSCYALYAVSKWQLPLWELKVMEYNLASDRIYERGVSAGDLSGAQEYIRGSASDMRALLADAASNAANEQDFPGTTDDAKCRRCNFQRLCPVRRTDEG